HGGLLGRLCGIDAQHCSTGMVATQKTESRRLSKPSAYIGQFVYARAHPDRRRANMPRAQSAPARPALPLPAVVVAAPAPAPAVDTPPKPPCAQIDSYSGDPNFMMSLARGLLVIQAFTQRKRQLTISQLSAKTGLSRAAVRRCLYTLAQLGFA